MESELYPHESEYFTMAEYLEREALREFLLSGENDRYDLDDNDTVTTVSSSGSYQEDTGDENDEPTDVLQNGVFLRPLQQQIPRRTRLIDARAHSLTVAWPAIPEAKFYRLETTSADNEFFRITSKVRNDVHQATITRLSPQQQYHVWITPILEDGRESRKLVPQIAFMTLSKEQERKCLGMPTTRFDRTNNELTVHWRLPRFSQACPRCYDLQVRQVGDACDGWRTIGVCLDSTSFTMKGVSPNENCQFRVKTSTQPYYSPPSKPTLSENIFRSILQLSR